MIQIVKLRKLLFFLTLLIVPALAEDSRNDIKFAERPRNSVFDPAGILSVKQQQQISQPLQKILKEENIDVLVAVLPELGESPPEHLARGFAERWTEKKLNAVILYVPQVEGAPWIFVSEAMTEAIKPEVLERDVSAAEKRAAAEPEDFGKIRAASIEAADLLRYWTGGAMLRIEKQAAVNYGAYLARENRKRLLKLAAILGAAAIIPLVAGFILILKKIRMSKPLEFPSTRRLARLGAPYSGGNHATSKGI